jgi:ABC-type sugar transport system substrate-binding protein
MKKATEDPLTKLADAAFRQAAQKVIKRAKESGTPVIVWDNGEVKRMEPQNAHKRTKPKT